MNENIISKLGVYDTVVDDGKGGYIYKDANNKELYHVYSDGKISYKIDNTDIILYSDGTYYIPANDTRGDYTINEQGQIVCKRLGGGTTVYNHSGGISKDGEVEVHFPDDPFPKPQKVEVEEDVDFHDYFSGNGPIIYDKNEYSTLMRLLINIYDDNTINIESDINSINDIMDRMTPDKNSVTTDKIKESITTQLKEIYDLESKINYSILAYDACDANLKQKVDAHFVDSLFDCFNPYLVNEIEKVLYDKVESEDYGSHDILVYKEDTNLSSIEMGLKKIIELDETLSDKSDMIITKYSDIDKRISSMSCQDIKSDLYHILENRGEDELNAILYKLEKTHSGYYGQLDFNPVKVDSDGQDYQIYSDVISLYAGETVNIPIIQILPNDCSTLEYFVYDLIKVDFIDSLRSVPDIMLTNNSLKTYVLTCDSTQNIDIPADGVAIFDAHEALMQNKENGRYIIDKTVYTLSQGLVPSLKDANNYPLKRNHYHDIANNPKFKGQNIDDVYATALYDYLFRKMYGYTEDKLKRKYGNELIWDFNSYFVNDRSIIYSY